LYYVYILASQTRGTTYIGITNDISRRTFEHREQLVQRFSKRNRVTRLIYMEPYEDVRDAIQREKQLKKWNRAWKLELIEKANPE
jgi:putative endonuclease